MIFNLIKISTEFHPFRQAEMNELVEDFLIMTAEENGCSLMELSERWGFKTMNYIIIRFVNEVQEIWREHENKNFRR